MRFLLTSLSGTLGRGERDTNGDRVLGGRAEVLAIRRRDIDTRFPLVLAPNQVCAAILDQPSHVLGEYESFHEETQDPERGREADSIDHH